MVKRIFDSLVIAIVLAGVLVGLQACGVAEGVAQLTAPVTCEDGTVVTGRSLYSEPGGETTTSVRYYCRTDDAEPVDVSGPVLAVEVFYMWLVSFALVMVVGGARDGSGDEQAAPPPEDGGGEPS